MAKELYSLSLDSIKLLCGLIRDLASVSEGIDNLHLADDKTFSNIHIKNLIDKCLQDANAEAEKLVGALTHLTCKETTVQPTLDNSEINVIYLYSADGNPPYQQYLKISDTKLVDLGSTSINLTDYLTITSAASTYAKQTDLKTLSDEVSGIKTKIGSDSLETTSDTLIGAINEVADKSAIITLTKAEYDTLATKDPETYYITTDDMTMYKGESQVLGGKPLIGKETVLYEGNISATGTYTLTDDVNNYDFIMISYTALGEINIQTLTMSKIEISKCIDDPHRFLCVYGYAANDSCITGYFNNDKLILNICIGLIMTSITGYKFGQVTVQNTITNPSPAASYSTDEQLTGGTWIDGKPIYRKTIDFGALPNTTSKEIPHGITNLDMITNIYGTSFSTSNIGIPLPFTSSTSSICVDLHYDTTYVRIITASDLSNYTKSYITLEYTKA